MTADDLRAIAARHLEDGRPVIECPTREQEARVCAQMYADRSALLALVRRVAEMDPVATVETCGGPLKKCLACMETADELEAVTHTPDCLWLICQGVRE